MWCWVNILELNKVNGFKIEKRKTQRNEKLRCTGLYYSGDSSQYSEKVSETINKRLGEGGWEELLAPPFSRKRIFFLSSEGVGPPLSTAHCTDLSINWCLGDASIEVLDSTNGFTVDG